MANKHYPIDEDIEIDIKLKINIKSISNYHTLSPKEIKEQVDEFKKEIKNDIISKIQGDYYNEEVTIGVDWWNYEVK